MALFIAAQTFQDLAYRLWIPVSHSLQDDLLAYLLPIDQARAILIMATIVLLIVPFVVIALRCFTIAPVASVLGLVFGAAFIGFEISHRSIDFFVVGAKWAHQFAGEANSSERDAILQRFALWNEMARGWYFPLLLSYLLSSCAFAVATWKTMGKSRWNLLAPIAFVLNAFRLMGRLLSSYAGQTWLNGLNEKLYFPTVLTINTLLLVWFFLQARRTGAEDAAGKVAA